MLRTKFSGYSDDGIRVYPKGGSKQRDYEGERVAERNRQREAFYGGTGYHSGKDAREKQYSDMMADITNSNRSRLDDEYSKAEKTVKMNLARAGLSGSSQEAYELEQLRKNYDRGITDIGSQAESAGAQARNSYESAISQGVQSINSGSQAATEVAAALAKFSAGIQQALEGAKGMSFGGFFDSLGSAVEQNQFAQAVNKGATGQVQTEDKGVKPITGGSAGGGRVFK